MAVTFDGNQNLSDMVHYDGVSTYTNRNKTTGDFFNDNDPVGACLYFTWDRGVWHDLTVNVGTQLVAAAITVVWEYYQNGVGWTAIPGLVDNTNAFQNAGVNTVAFTVPTLMGYRANIGVNTNDGWMIRARITAITNISEGGANQTTAVYGKDHAIKVTGDETLASIKTADTGGGWGMINNTANYYQIISNLRLAGNLVIQSQTLDVGTSAERRLILKSSGILQLGYKDGSGNIYNGATLNYWNNTSGGTMSPNNYWYGTLNMYNSLLWKSGGGFGDYGLICVLGIESSALETAAGVIFSLGASGSMKNVTFSMNGNQWLYWYSSACAIDNLIFGYSRGILAGTSNVTVTNTDFGTDKIYTAGNNNKTVYSLNCTFDDVPAQAIPGSGAGNKMYTKHTLEFTIIDENNNPITGYEVKLTNSQGDVLNDGAWSNTDLVTYYSWDLAVSPYTRTDVNYNPFTFEIKKAGYQTYKSKMTLTNANRKLTIRLRKIKEVNLSKRARINM